MSLAEGMHAPTNPGSVPRPAWTKTLPDGEDLPAAAIEAGRGRSSGPSIESVRDARGRRPGRPGELVRSEASGDGGVECTGDALEIVRGAVASHVSGVVGDGDSGPMGRTRKMGQSTHDAKLAPVYGGASQTKEATSAEGLEGQCDAGRRPWGSRGSL